MVETNEATKGMSPPVALYGVVTFAETMQSEVAKTESGKGGAAAALQECIDVVKRHIGMIGMAPTMFALLTEAADELLRMHEEYLPKCEGKCPTLELTRRIRLCLAGVGVGK